MVAICAGLVVVHNVQVWWWPEESVSLLANLALAAAVLIALPPHSSSPAEESASLWRRTVALAGAVAVATLLLVPGASELRWWRVVIAIPIGTALCEEVIFRGVLLDAWARARRSPARSNLIVSATFGVWHLSAEAHRLSGWTPEILVGVGLTFVLSAVILVPLRRRTGTIVAPWSAHAITNVFVFLLQ